MLGEVLDRHAISAAVEPKQLKALRAFTGTVGEQYGLTEACWGDQQSQPAVLRK